MTVAAPPAFASSAATSRPPLGLWASVLFVLITADRALAQATTRPATAPVAATQPYRPTLLAYGSAETFWTASVDSVKDGGKMRMRTLVRGQELPAGDWQDLGAVYGHAVALTESQGALALLLDDGSWRRLGPDGLTTGTMLPGAGPVFAWGASAKDLYAVRAVDGGKAGVTTRPVAATFQPRRRRATATTTAATSPATTQAVATSRPTISAPSITTRPAPRPPRLVLLRLEQGQWNPVADLPADVTPGSMSLAVIGNKPTLAVAGRGGALRTLAWTDNRWQDLGEVHPSDRQGGFGLLAAGAVPALWTIDPQGAMKLFIKREGEDWSPASAFALPPNLSENAQRTLAVAGQELRLLVLKDGKVSERRYDLTGAPRSDLAELPVPHSDRPDPLYWAIRTFVIVGMILVMLLTFYRRQPPEDARDDR